MVRFRDDGPEIEDFKSAVVAGLGGTPKTLPCKFFYDKAGSELFDRICELEEYYPTRTELGLLADHGAEVAALSGEACHVIEFGSGSGVKSRLLLDSLDQPAAYTAIDISRQHLLDAAGEVAAAFPGVAVEAICADYTRDPPIRSEVGDREGIRVGFFPGSTIGNFTPVEAAAFLRHAARTLGSGALMLVGVDLKKDEDVLVAAYNDREGVTAAFNENLLVRINRELDGDFDLASFDHEAVYNGGLGRIEMHLVSARSQTVRVDGHGFDFRAGETIHTENSYKFTMEEFRRLADSSGYRTVRAWTDAAGMFSLHFLRVT